MSIEVPPLRKRRGDIPLLAEFFIRTYPGPENLRRMKLSKAAARALRNHDWPGNVRELKNVIEQALILGDTIDEAAFRDSTSEGVASRSRRWPLGGQFSINRNGRFSATAGTVLWPANMVSGLRPRRDHRGR